MEQIAGCPRRCQRLGNHLADKFAKLPPMRVSHAVTGFKPLAQQAARWASEAHVFDTMDLERTPKKRNEAKRDHRCVRQDEGTLSCHDDGTFRRLLRGAVHLLVKERSGRSKVVLRDTTPCNQQAVGAKDANHMGPGSSSSPNWHRRFGKPARQCKLRSGIFQHHDSSHFHNL